MAVGVGKMTLQPLRMKGFGVGVALKQKPLPDDHPFYPLIGRIVAEWARLEHELDMIIWDHAKTDPAIGSCITSQIGGYHGRFAAIAAVIDFGRRRDKTMEKRITTLRSKVGNLAKERARYVHDAWFILSSGDEPDDVNAVGQFSNFSVDWRTFGFLPIEEEKLRQFIQDIKQKTEQISTLRSDLSNRPPRP